ncbi:uncharacterized protein LOC128218518 [Mya arenaria]|uniref:uncharacterized protein LOC128218518 n=1 Tax=Mya arenaria TaxID=6604 RepID=UPI0022DEBBF0|nr:uncharacterized protein LOC128218518 [Mya arenaria]
MYVEYLHLAVVTALLVTMTPVVQGNAFIDAYNQATRTLDDDDIRFETLYNNRADFFMQAVHVNGPKSSTIAKAANLVNLLAVFLNVPTVGDVMAYDNFDNQLDTVVDRINGICPLKNIEVSHYRPEFEECVQADNESPWRPITGICNNLKHPRWGTPGIAQLRLAPASWENVGLVEFNPVPVHLTPVQPRGVQLVPNNPLIFNLQGTGTFTLAVTYPERGDPESAGCTAGGACTKEDFDSVRFELKLNSNCERFCQCVRGVSPNSFHWKEFKCSPGTKFGIKEKPFFSSCYHSAEVNCEEQESKFQENQGTGGGAVCTSVNVKKENEGDVDGIIISAIPNKDGCAVEFDGSHYIASGKKCRKLEICYEPFYVLIELDPRKRKESTLKIGGEVVDTNKDELFDDDTLHTFWVRFENDKLQVGAGSEVSEQNVILKGTTDPTLGQDLLNTRNAISISAGKADSLTAKFPVFDRIILETEPGRPQSLAGLPFLFESHVVRFGIRTPGAASNLDNKHVIDLENTNTNEKLTVTFRANRTGNEINVDEIVINFRRDLTSPVEEVTVQSVKVPHVDFVDGSGKTHNEFSAFWISAISNRLYAGAGNEVGKNAMIDLYSIPQGTTAFRPNDVIVRSMDGDASNPKHAQWILDLMQWGTPRKTSLAGRSLPTARDVSLAVHTNIGASTTWSDTLTMAVMQMGQFVDHDLIATPVETGSGHINCHCVNGSYIETEEIESRFCFNINITEKTDPSGSQGEFSSEKFDCFAFVRSSATLECNADNQLRDLRNREQLNELTAYVDGSNIYGSEQTAAKELRKHDEHLRGFLATSVGPIHSELPFSTVAGEGEASCNNGGNDSFPCHLAGDFRVNEQPSLASMHTLWVREHNRVAQELVDNCGYEDDTEAASNELYHAARRIVIAEYQNIVYDGYLRSFTDAGIFEKFNLNSCSDGSCSYDDSINPSITNEWGIANRMGHTWINNHLVGEGKENPAGFELKDNFFRPTLLHTSGSDVFIKNLYTSRCPNTDNIIETSVTENLFRMGTKIALDLAALNIQRGRDHGVSYCATRKALGLKVPATFQEAENMELFSTETIALLKDCYDRICDIDLFTAIVAELPLQNRTDQTSDSPIPETLNHIQGDMFQKLKLGDRFWFEFPRAGFNEAQKEALRKITLSTIICENVLKSGSDEIQPNAFHVAGEGNEKVSCNAIPKLDITLFQRDSFELRDEGTEGAAQRDYNIPPANDGTSGEADRILPNEPEGNTVDDAAEEREIEDEIDHLIDMFARLDEKEPHEEN